MSAVVAALLAGCAVVLVRPVSRGRAVPGWIVAGFAGVGLVAHSFSDGLPWRVVVPASIVLAAVAGLFSVRSARRRAAVAARTGAQVQEVCELVSGELSAGLPLARCLDEAATVWPPLTAVAGAHMLGGSVPDALRELAERPGAADLRLVAAAWQVAARSGSGLAQALGEVGATIRDRESTRRLVRSELASARSTARLMAVLPVLTLAMGSGVGGDPVRFLLATPIGLGCLAAGVALSVTGLRWIEAISAGVEAEA